MCGAELRIAANPVVVSLAREVENVEHVLYVGGGGPAASVLCQVANLGAPGEGLHSPRPGRWDSALLGKWFPTRGPGLRGESGSVRLISPKQTCGNLTPQ